MAHYFTRTALFSAGFFLSDVKYPKVASWDSFFQSSVSRVLLTLVGSPPGPSDPNRSVDIVPVSDKGKVYIPAKWLVRPELILVSIA